MGMAERSRKYLDHVSLPETEDLSGVLVDYDDKEGARHSSVSHGVIVSPPDKCAEGCPHSEFGSEQESVRSPGFIGFPRFGADGLTRFHGPVSESSPMFTDLSARSCIDRRGRRKSPVSVYADDRHGPTHQRTQGRAATQRAKSIGWCDGLHGALREGQTAPKIPSNKGFTAAISPLQSANSRIQGSQRLRCSQQVDASDRPLGAGILMPAIPGRAKRSSLRQLAVSPNSRAEPQGICGGWSHDR
jgi:hypothetical protein